MAKLMAPLRDAREGRDENYYSGSRQVPQVLHLAEGFSFFPCLFSVPSFRVDHPSNPHGAEMSAPMVSSSQERCGAPRLLLNTASYHFVLAVTPPPG